MAISTQRLREQAARWFIRMRRAEQDDPERSKFEAWLMSDPVHAREYSVIAETWEAFDSTPRLQSLAKAMEQKRHDFLEQKNKAGKLIKQGLLSVLLMVALGLFGHALWNEWQSQPVLQTAYSTSTGEIKSVAMDDGSRLILNGGAKVHVTYYRNKRTVALTQGEVIFDVAKDARRPFMVEVSTARVTVLGTRFAVNQMDHMVRVSVEHGSVRVEKPLTAQNEEPDYVILHDGQVAEIMASGGPQLVHRSATDAFAFQSGTLVFENATLGEIAETLSRYRRIPVKVLWGHSQASKITAVLQVYDIENFIRMLPQIANVRVHDTPTETQLLSNG
jgi:transmembrane sensor